jgi:hypothetical protein
MYTQYLINIIYLSRDFLHICATGKDRSQYLVVCLFDNLAELALCTAATLLEQSPRQHTFPPMICAEQCMVSRMIEPS